MNVLNTPYCCFYRSQALLSRPVAKPALTSRIAIADCRVVQPVRMGSMACDVVHGVQCPRTFVLFLRYMYKRMHVHQSLHANAKRVWPVWSGVFRGFVCGAFCGS